MTRCHNPLHAGSKATNCPGHSMQAKKFFNIASVSEFIKKLLLLSSKDPGGNPPTASPQMHRPVFCFKIKQLCNIDRKIVLVFDSLFIILYRPVDKLPFIRLSAYMIKKVTALYSALQLSLTLTVKGGR